MKKKVCIVSTSQVDNYGAVLQNYALQEKLSSNFDVKTLNYLSKNLQKNNKILFEGKFRLIKSMAFSLLYPTYKHSFKSKHRKFVFFRNRYIKYTPFIEQNDLPKINNEFDYFLSGSDQVFNLNIYSGETTSLLDFVDDNNKKKTYAASFGGSLGTKYYGDTKKYVTLFSSLLIREREGVEIVKTWDKEAKLVIDPIFLLSKDEWIQKLDLLECPVVPKNKYILVYMLSYDDNIAQTIKKLATKENLLIVNIFGGVSLDHFKGKVKNVTPGPDEFVALINGAEYVFAVSFHGIAFSILFNKNFYYSLRNKHDSSSLRTLNLLQNFDLPSREICGGKLPDNTIDWNRVNQNLISKRNYSLSSLFNSLGDSSDILLDEPELAKHKLDNISVVGVRCVGCENCEKACPTGAISLYYDDESFLYPRVDNEKCINCGKCLITCPTYSIKKTIHTTKCLALSLKDDKNLYLSTSGGVAQALYRYYLSIGGVGYGVAYSDDYCAAKYIRVDSEESLSKVLKSKYLPAKTENIFSSVKDDLISKRPVVFVGTPCIISALRLYLNNDYEDLLCVELICHGPTSPLVVKKYFEEQNVRKHGGISYFSMRQKGYGHSSLCINLELSDGKKIIEPFNNKSSLGAGYECISRPSCYSCPTKGDYRQGDITIGDYWGCVDGVKGYNKNGTSLAFLQTEKGRSAFSKISHLFNVDDADYDLALSHNLTMVDSITPFFGRMSFINRAFVRKQKMTVAMRKSNRKTVKIKKSIPTFIKVAIKKIVKR